MPDRFDLMKPGEVVSCLRISIDWSTKVNRSGLTSADVSRLEAGTLWLEAMVADLKSWLDDGPLQPGVFDQPPALPEQSGEMVDVVDRFRKVNEQAMALLASVERSRWHTTAPYTTGTTVMFDDLAKHVARVSQSAGVDKNWIW